MFITSYYFSNNKCSFHLQIQLHANSESLLSDLHGVGLGLLGLHDDQEYCSGEGDEVERNFEGHGRYKPCALVHVVHRHLPHDGLQHGPAHSDYHGERRWTNTFS